MSEKVTMQKTELLMRAGWEPTGVVMARMRDGKPEHLIVDQGAVRRLEGKEFWDLMHPTPEPKIPVLAERYTGGPEGSNWVKGWATKFWGLRYE